MKRCPRCGSENSDYFNTCLDCGANLKEVPIELEDSSATSDVIFNQAKKIINIGARKAQQAATAQRADVKNQDAKFVMPDESFQAAIGSNYLQSILGGGQLARSAAILTEKRVYYYGKSFSGIGKNLKSSTEEAIIPAEDITSTRFVHGRNTGLLIMAVILLVIGILTSFAIIGLPLVIAGGWVLFRYFTGRTTMFEIAFPGGRYYFDVKWYPISDMQDFQRQLHLVRDRLKNN